VGALFYGLATVLRDFLILSHWRDAGFGNQWVLLGGFSLQKYLVKKTFFSKTGTSFLILPR
jgi:hypothetical protein